MPQARSSGSSSGSSSGRTQTKRSSAKKSTGAKRTTARKSTSAKSSAGRSSAGARSNGAPAADPRLEAVAQRVRKLNERIIEAGKGAGELTLSSYEKALKSIASTLERGPGSSDVEWISALATTQARWIRDVTEAWTSAARGMIK